MSDKIEYWSCDKSGINLLCREWHEAVEEFIDEHEGELPETVEVYGFAVCDLPSVENLAKRAVDEMMKYLDENFGGDDPQEPTAEVKSAALEFAKALRDGFLCQRCRLMKTQIVNLEEYIAGEWVSGFLYGADEEAGS